MSGLSDDTAGALLTSVVLHLVDLDLYSHVIAVLFAKKLAVTDESTWYIGWSLTKSPEVVPAGYQQAYASHLESDSSMRQGVKPGSRWHCRTQLSCLRVDVRSGHHDLPMCLRTNSVIHLKAQLKWQRDDLKMKKEACQGMPRYVLRCRH